MLSEYIFIDLNYEINERFVEIRTEAAEFNILQDTDMPATTQSITAAKKIDVVFKFLWSK